MFITTIIVNITYLFFFSYFQLCDISLRVGITTLSAHRVVLAAASPYFHAMFNGKFFHKENEIAMKMTNRNFSSIPNL